MTGDRYRMVYIRNGEKHVSSIVLSADEVEEHLDWEQDMHEQAGWTVARIFADALEQEHDELFCLRWPRDGVINNGNCSRRVIYAKRFSAMEDSVAAQGDDSPSPAPPPTQRRGDMSIEVASKRDKEKLTSLVRWVIVWSLVTGYSWGFAMGWWFS